MADQKSVETVKPLEGTTTVDDKVAFEAERLSYRAASRLAVQVADLAASRVKGEVVVVAGDAFMADLGNLASARLQLEMLTRDFDGVAALAPASAPKYVAGPGLASMAIAVAPVAAVTAGLQATLGLVSFLRENVEFKGVATKIDPRAFEIALAARLRRSGAKAVFVPDLLSLTTHRSDAESLQKRWSGMQRARQAAWKAAGPLLADLAAKESQLDAASKAGKPQDVERLSEDLFKLRRELEPFSETLQRAERRLSELQTQWDKVSETTGLSTLARLMRAEIVDEKSPLYVHAAVVASGGHNRISRNLFRIVFLGDGVSAMGGTVIRWALIDRDGSLALGGVLDARERARFPTWFDVDSPT